MSGSIVIEIAIGLILVYLTFSLFCSAINEWIARFLALRAAGLRRGLDELFEDVDETGFASLFHQHPLIDALKPSKAPVIRRLPGRWFGRERVRYPSYISADTFAIAMLDLATNQTSPGMPGVGLRATLKQPGELPVPLPRSVVSLLAAVDGDADAMRARLVSWFNDSMDRVSGWYKRRTHVILFVIGAIVALLFNLDTFRIANQLANEPSVREALVRQADDIVSKAQNTTGGSQPTTGAQDSVQAKQIAEQIAALERAGLSFGWTRVCAPTSPSFWTLQATPPCQSWPLSLVGIFVTTVALSFGAPFWFDALNKVTNLRQAGTPPDAAKRN
ncbi:MAG TPA: hypothetical protein VHB25_16885 [Gemmatimonadaceae bacterium]|nr:hypothetical protein [Gemmatimonadaceae bacterium]